MKRIIIAAAVVICVGLAGLAALPFVVSNQSIKQHLAQRIQELTASRISYQGEPNLTFSPYLGVELVNVVMSGENQVENEPDLLRVEKLQFGLKILPLIFGKTRFSDFKMIRPRFSLLVRQNGTTNWANTRQPEDLQKSQQEESEEKQITENVELKVPLPIADIKLGQFEIIDGIVESNVGDAETAFRLSNLHAIVNWPSLASSWKIAGRGIWRGEAFEFSNSAENPLALFTSGKSGLSLKFDSPTLTASFDGQAIMVSDIQLVGDASMATPSIPRLYELLFENQPVDLPPFGNFLVRGKVSANAHEIQFDDSEIELGLNAATGNLILRRNENKKPKISGTLAFSSLDITPLVEIVSSKPPTKAISGNRMLIENRFDFDVRFSAKNYRFRENSFGALAATAMLTDNEWAFDIGEADFFDGVIIATITSKTVKNIEEIELKGTMRNVSMGKIARDWYGGEFVATGNTDVDFSLKAPGAANLGNFREFYGSMKVSLTDGRIEGVDLVKAIPALIKNNGFVTVDEIKGVTPFNDLSLDLLIYNGVGWITKGKATSNKNEFRLSGKADLLRGSLAIYTDISRKASGNVPAQLARIFIGGTVKNPLVTRSPLAKLRPDERVQQGG